MITLWRIFAASWKHLARNAWLATATIFVFMMALLSVNILLGMNAMLGRVINLLEEKVDVTVSFKVGTPEGVVNQARFYLTSLPQVRDVRYVTADEALKAFKARHANDPKVLSALAELTANPLGAQIVVKAQSADDYAFLMQAIQNPQYASFIQSQTYDDHRTTIAKIRDIGRNVRIVGAALVAIFALFGMMIAFNAIRVGIYTHREEIAIMRLVGASSFYLRAPFILEGIWIAAFGLLLAGAIFISALFWVEPILRPLFDGGDPGLINYFRGQAPLIIGMEAGAMLLLVTSVSWAAVGRYIRR